MGQQSTAIRQRRIAIDGGAPLRQTGNIVRRASAHGRGRLRRAWSDKVHLQQLIGEAELPSESEGPLRRWPDRDGWWFVGTKSPLDEPSSQAE